jgi:hypothetical protein
MVRPGIAPGLACAGEGLPLRGQRTLNAEFCARAERFSSAATFAVPPLTWIVRSHAEYPGLRTVIV